MPRSWPRRFTSSRSPWSSVQEARVTGFFLGKKLRLRGSSPAGQVAIKHRIPNPLFGLLAPMKNNVGGARAIEQAFQATRALVAAPPVASLPPAPEYALPPAQPAYAPPPPLAPSATLPATPSFIPPPPSMPPQNAPGYTSVRPASASSPAHGIAPTPLRSNVPRPPQA